MNKRRRPPSEQRAEKANRILAEMVLRGPRTPRASDPGGRANNPGEGALNHVQDEAKVKTEAQGSNIQAVPIQSLARPVAMSLVDFSFVLSLVFGGCCS